MISFICMCSLYSIFMCMCKKAASEEVKGIISVYNVNNAHATKHYKKIPTAQSNVTYNKRFIGFYKWYSLIFFKYVFFLSGLTH